MKYILKILLSLCFFCSYGILSFSTVDKNIKIYDEAQLFTIEEKEQLSIKANALSTTYNIDVVIVTTNSNTSKSAQTYADDFYDYNGFQDNGVLFLIDITNRNYWISTTGKMIDILTDNKINNIKKNVKNNLSQGAYGKSSMIFLTEIETHLLNQSQSKKKLTRSEAIAGGVSLAFIISFLITCIRFFLRKRKISSQKSKYTNQNTISFTKKQDLFLYSNTTKTYIKPNSSNESSTHTSNSGQTHGGGGGSF